MLVGGLTGATDEAVSHGVCTSEMNSSRLEADAGSGCPSGIDAAVVPSLSQALTMPLQAPSHPPDRELLGLDQDAREFALAELDTDLLVILVFDMYCHVCRQSAQNMKWTSEQIQNSPYIKNARVVGIGRGDTDFEVQTFRKKLKLDFACVPDRNKQVTDAMGIQRTPSGYILCRKSGEYRFVSSFEGYLSKAKAKEFMAPLFSGEQTE